MQVWEKSQGLGICILALALLHLTDFPPLDLCFPTRKIKRWDSLTLENHPSIITL